MVAEPLPKLAKGQYALFHYEVKTGIITLPDGRRLIMKDPLGSKKKIPFAFALEELDALSPATKPMFGGCIVYIGGKMTLFLYDRDKLPPQFKGVSLATTPEHYRNLAQEF